MVYEILALTFSRKKEKPNFSFPEKYYTKSLYYNVYATNYIRFPGTSLKTKKVVSENLLGELSVGGKCAKRE
jgi:hypothetical protein